MLWRSLCLSFAVPKSILYFGWRFITVHYQIHHQSKNINFIEISLVFTAFIRQMPWNFGSYLALVKLRLGQMFCVCESVSYCDRLGLFWFSSDVKCEIPSKPFTRTILMEWDGHRNGEKERVRWGTKMARVFDLVCGMSNTHNIWWWTFSLYKYWTNGRTNERTTGVYKQHWLPTRWRCLTIHTELGIEFISISKWISNAHQTMRWVMVNWFTSGFQSLRLNFRFICKR